MHPKKILAVLTAVIFLGSSLVSCAEGERTPAEPIIESDAEVDTAPVELSGMIDYAERLELMLNVPVGDESMFVAEVVNGTVKITGYTGDEKEISVPETIGGLPVTKIAASAFAGRTDMTVMVIPESVTSVERGILAGCDALQVLETPVLGADADADGQYLGYLFGADSYLNNPLDIPASLKLVRISGQMETLPAYALYDCNDLTCVELPETVRTVEKFAFYNCSSLESVLHLENVVSLGEYALSYCTELKTLTLGVDTEEIGFAAFEGCIALQAMTLPFVGQSPTENTYLGYVFGAKYPDFAKGYYPALLQRVELLNTCTALGNNAFYECETLKEVLLPKGLESVGVRAFYGCTALWSVVLPDSVTTIREAAFTGCDSLLSVDFGNSLTAIGVNAFYDCDSLTAITLPATLTSLPASCFARCLSLENVDLGGVTSVGAQAFRHCIAVRSVTADGVVDFAEGNEHVKAVLYPEND
ncbi:MAG: leucine-rich repeat domain-containing protein [Clostridia bacterium]|nr:leucine-rich repeat domain-containing protein [Clostridia bacterium]